MPGLLLPDLLAWDAVRVFLPPEPCSVAIVALKADDDGEAPACSEAGTAVLLSATLLAAGELTVLAATLRATPPLLLAPLSPADGCALPVPLLPPAPFLLVPGSLVLARVAAVALNRVLFGAGSLKVPGFAAVRVDCFISRQALSLARMSPPSAGSCVATDPVRSALCTPGRSAVLLGLLMAADMLRLRGVCMPPYCLLCRAALPDVLGVAAGGAGAGVANCCMACLCAAEDTGVGRGAPLRVFTPRAVPLAPPSGPVLAEACSMRGVPAWCGCCVSTQPTLPYPARLALPVRGPGAPRPPPCAAVLGCRYRAATCHMKRQQVDGSGEGEGELKQCGRCQSLPAK